MDKDTFSEIYDLYYPKLLRFSNNYLLRREESENVVQDLFLYLWEHKEMLPTLHNVNAYLFTMVRNRCIDYLRREMNHEDRKGNLSEVENKEMQLKLYSLEMFDNDRLSDTDVEKLLHQAIDKLPERCREIFIMSRLQNLRHKEISNRLGISPNTVENQIAIAIRKLKDELREYFPLFLFII